MPESEAAAATAPRLRRRHLISSGALTFAGRILQVATSALIGLLLPLGLSPASIGLFFTAQAATAAAGILGQVGLTLAVPSVVTAAIAVGDRGRARSAIVKALAIAAVAGLSSSLLLAGLLIGARELDEGPLVGGLFSLMVLLCAITPLAAVLPVVVEVHRSLRAMALASFLPALQGLALLGFIAIALTLSMVLDVSELIWVALLSIAVATVVGAAALWSRARHWTSPALQSITVSEMLALGWPNLVTILALFVTSSADLLIVSAFGGAVEAAYYGLGARIAALLALPRIIVGLTITPQIVATWTRGRRRNLQWLLTLTATGASLVVVLAYVVLAVLGGPGISWIWGEAYAPAFAVALILGFGHVVHTMSGASGALLMLLGQHKVVMRTTIGFALATLALSTLAMTSFGIFGVAVVYSLANVAQAASFLYLSRRHFSLASNAKLLKPRRLRRLLSNSGAWNSW